MRRRVVVFDLYETPRVRRAFRDGVVIDLDGIVFDLRRGDLDLTLWEPIDLPVLERCSDGWVLAFSGDVRQQQGAVFKLEAGDRVTLGPPQEDSATPPFGSLDLRESQARLRALLEVRRRDGTKETSDAVIRFRSRLDPVEPLERGDYLDFFRILVRRLAQATGTDFEGPLDDRENGAEAPATAYATSPVSDLTRQAVGALWASGHMYDDAAAAAAAFGYLMARRETEEGILPSAMAQVDQKALALARSKKGNEKHVAARMETRLAAMKEIDRAGRQHSSLTGCAKAIAPDRDVKAVSSQIRDAFERRLDGTWKPYQDYRQILSRDRA